MLMVHFIARDRVKARPLAVIQAVAQGKGAVVKCGTDGQEQTSKDKKISCAPLNYTRKPYFEIPATPNPAVCQPRGPEIQKLTSCSRFLKEAPLVLTPN
jgi:hypothetical protein